MTRLTDLAPKWIQPLNLAHGVTLITGVSFLCPHCAPLDLPAHGPQRARHIVAMFANPIDPDGWVPRTEWRPDPHQPAWQRLGETLDTLTLEPSIDVSANGHWHGRVTAGELVNA